MKRISVSVMMAAFMVLLGAAPAAAGVVPLDRIDVAGGDSATAIYNSNTLATDVTQPIVDGASSVLVGNGASIDVTDQIAVHTASGGYTITIDGTVKSAGSNAVQADGSGNIIYHESSQTIIAVPNGSGVYGDGIVSGDETEVYNYGVIDTYDENFPVNIVYIPGSDPLEIDLANSTYGRGGVGIRVGNDSDVENYGTIESGEGGIIAGTGAYVLNGDTGIIRSDLNGTGFPLLPPPAPLCAITVGDGSDVTNAGSIDSATSIGIHAGSGSLDVNDGSRLNFITNEATGTIDAYLAGIQAGNNYNITNSGQITGGFGIFAGDNNVIVNNGFNDIGDTVLDDEDGVIYGDAVGILLQVDPATIDVVNIEQSILVNLLSDVDPARTAYGNSVTNNGIVGLDDAWKPSGAGIVGVANNTIVNNGISAGYITGIGALEGNTITNNGLVEGGLAGVIVRNNANTVTNNGGILSGMIGIASDVGNTVTNTATGEIGLLKETAVNLSSFSELELPFPTGIGIAAFDGNTINNFGSIASIGAGIFVLPESPVSAAFSAAGEELAGMGLTLPAYLDGYTLAGNIITNGDPDAEVQIAAERGIIRVLGSEPNDGLLGSYGILVDSRGEFSGPLVSSLQGIEYTPSTYWDVVNARNADEDPSNDFVIGTNFFNVITNNGLINSFYTYYDDDLGDWVDEPYYGGGIFTGDFSDVTNNGLIFVTETGIAGYDGNRIVNNGEIRADYEEPAIINCGIHVGNQNYVENNGVITSYTSDGIVAGDDNTIINSGIVYEENDEPVNFSRIYGYDSGIVAGMGNTIHNRAGGWIIAGNMDGEGEMAGISAGNSEEPIILLVENSYSTVRGVNDEQAIRDSISNRITNDGYIRGVATGISAGSHAEVTNAALNVYTLSPGIGGFEPYVTFWDGMIEGGEVGIHADSFNLITNDGYIHSDFEPGFATGIHLGYENVVINNGLIWSEEAGGVSGDFHNTITNNGTIFAETIGIYGLEFNRIVNNSLIDNGVVTACYGPDCTDFLVENTEDLVGTGIEVGHDNDVINTGTINASDYGILSGANNSITNSGTITAASGSGIYVNDNDGAQTNPDGSYVATDVNVITNDAPGTISGITGIVMDGQGIININGGSVLAEPGNPAILTDNNGSFNNQFITIATGATINSGITEGNGCLGCDSDVLTFTGSGYGNFETDISLIEQIRKTGTGTWRLGDSSENSTIKVDIEQGTLQFDGYITAEDVYIWGGATLAGDGEIWINSVVPDSVFNGGTIAPGPADGGIGGLTIQDGTFYNYFCNNNDVCTTGNLEIELEDTGSGVVNDTLHVNSDRTAIFGSESLGGGTVTAIPLNFIPAGTYTFLYSDNLVVNADPTLIAPAGLLLRFSLDWDENNMWLEVNRRSVAEIGGNENDQTIFDLISELADAGNPDAEETLGDILRSDDPLSLLGQLSPEQYPNLLDVSMAGFDLYRSGVLGRMGNLHLTRGARDLMYADNSNTLVNGDPALARLPAFKRTPGGWSGWARVLGLTGDQDGNNGILGYEIDSFGLALGFDNQVTDNLVLGIGGGYTENDVDFDDLGQDTDMDAYHVSLYGSYSTKAYYIDGAVLYASNDYDTDRQTPGVKATSSTDGTEWGVYVGGGYNLVDDTDWYFIPTASAAWAQVDIDGFTEKGAGPFNLDVDDYDTDSLVTTLGFRLGANLAIGATKVEPELRLSWAHEFGDTDRDVRASFAMGGPSFTIEGVKPDRDSALVGAGLNAYLTESTTLFIDYDGEFRGDFDAHMLSGGFRYNF